MRHANFLSDSSVYIYCACLCVLGSNCAYLAGVKYTLDTERSKLRSMARYEGLNVYIVLAVVFICA